MSLTSYIGSNVQIPVKSWDDELRDGEIHIGRSFADEEMIKEVKDAQFSSKYVYEVTYDWWGMELSPYDEKQQYEKSKIGLHQLCDEIASYLEEGDFFEFYTCWVGDESQPKEGELVLPIQGWFRDGMEVREQTLVTFYK